MQKTLENQEPASLRGLMRKHIALPQDHGSWVFLISPLLIGLFAGGRFNLSTLILVLAAFAAFLIRQPVTIITKALSGRRSRRDLPPAYFWFGVYALVGLASLVGLLSHGFGYLLYLAVPGLPVFAWHLWLVSRRSERRQVWVELLGTGALALAAPAAYWVSLGRPDPAGWALFLLAWMQSAASIVYAYLRLEQRQLPAVPPVEQRLRMAMPALLFTTANLLVVAGFSLAGALPGAMNLSAGMHLSAWLPLAYAVQWLESIYGALKPAVGVKPTRIGLRQLIVSIIFTLVFIITW